MVSLVISTLKTHCWPVGTERSVLPTGRATEMVLRAAARWCFGQCTVERERERYHRVPQDPAVVQQTVAVEKGEGSTRAGPLSLLRAFSSRCPGAAARSEQSRGQHCSAALVEACTSATLERQEAPISADAPTHLLIGPASQCHAARLGASSVRMKRTCEWTRDRAKTRGRMTCRSWVCWRWTKKIVAPVIVTTADSATKPERGRRAIVVLVLARGDRQVSREGGEKKRRTPMPRSKTQTTGGPARTASSPPRARSTTGSRL